MICISLVDYSELTALLAQLDALVDEMTPYIAKEMDVTTDHARHLAKRWVLEAVAEMIYSTHGDVLFLEHSS